MQYNQRNPAVRRLLKEAKELKEEEGNGDYRAEPMEDNLFEWHFTIRGPPETPFHNGQYHGRILLPVDYPMKPPSIIFLTPNGRFKVGEKICLSITGYHPEYWQPAWGIRTVCVAVLSFFPTQGNGAIGSLDYTDEERRLYAKKSLSWTCPNCVSKEKMSLPDVAPASSSTPKPRPEGESLPEFSFVYEKDKVVTPTEGGNSTEAAKEPTSGGESSDIPPQSPTLGVAVNGSDNKEESEGEGKEEEAEETIVVDKGKKRETLNEPGLSGLRYRYSSSGSGTTTAEMGGGARVKGEAQPQPPKPPQPQTQAQAQAQTQAQPQAQAQRQPQAQAQQQQQQPPPQESLIRGVLDLLIFLLTSLLAYILYLKYQTPGPPS